MKQIHIIPDVNDLARTLQLAEKWDAAFEYNDFFLPDVLEDVGEFQKRISVYKGLGRSRAKDTLHGAFFDLCINSYDREIVRVSEMRMRQSMEAASQLGARAVIFHTNIISGFAMKGYVERWVEQNEKFFRRLLKEYRGIEIFMENMFDQTPEALAMLADTLSGTGFGVCLDVAHANLSKTVSLEAWFKDLMPHIRHLHINDNDGTSDLHQALGDGCMDWTEFHSQVNRFQLECSVLVEVSGTEKSEKSLQYMKTNGIYPF